MDKNTFIYGVNENQSREIASLTKIMTLWTILKLLEVYSINERTIYFTVSQYAASIGGTSANLKSGDELTILDLLYGMMLPSGNDAALCLAQNFNKIIIEKEKISQN